MASGKKRIRTDKESGPIRISDHIFDWFVYGDRQLTESEGEYIELFNRLELSHGNDLVYKDGNGELLPEILDAMIYIKIYSNKAGEYAKPGESAKPGQKQWFDI